MNRLIGLVVLVAAAMTSIAQPGSASSGQQSAALTGTVTITGSETGYIPVRVTKDMSLGDPFLAKYRNAVTVTGGGKAAGFALVEDGLQGAVVLGGKSNAFAPSIAKSGIPVSSLNRAEPDNGVTFAVPAGSYRLYLITGGKPTTVTLRFIGGTGSSRLTPTTKADSVVQGGPLDVLAPGPLGGVFGGGGAVTLSTPVVQFSLNRFDTDIHTETALRYCFYTGRKPSGPQPYGPACAAPGESDAVVFDPGAETFIVSDEGVGQASFYGFSGSLTTSGGTDQVVEADLAAGISLTSGGVVTGTDYTQFWLSLNPTLAAPAKTAPTARTTAAPTSSDPTSQDAAATGRAASVKTLPATGLTPSLALAPVLLLAAALVGHTRRP